ncbi:hypothetical protein M407DRAFT_29547 [Tulasnella calospora MUT 4182]|uniref:Extracellular metalloproteinase n=1 Tax=Tulasnella calospora MUT 4182 TaxID=1051891 RepID=A0A0C3Q9Z1_9AGAM|nr:hypothetical protein M407DRAFT_29547 [Tulasnella calospora MUT 4182]
MPVFSKITTTLSAVLALTSTVVHAAPLQPTAAPDHNYHLSTHRRHVGASNLEFVSYHPPSSYKTFHDGDHSLLSRSTNATHSLVSRAPAGPSGVSPEVEEAALSYLSQQTGLTKDSLKVRSGYTNDIGVTHVYMTQMLNGIPVTNGVANISFDKTGKVVAFGSNMVKPDQISPATPAFPQSAAIQSAQKALGISHYDAVPVTLSYVLQPAPSGTDPNRKWATLTHQFQLRNADTSKWVQAHVDATNPKQGKVVHVVNFVADAAYNVVEWSQQDPTWSGFKLLTDPQDTTASPNGWHVDTAGEHTDTRGNNVLSYFGQDMSKLSRLGKLTNGMLPEDITTSQQSSDGLVFDYEWDPTASPSTPQNMDVARVNAFYVTNKYHDTLYKYGFTEAAFNFQDDNYGKGGEGSDWVEMQVQAPGTNNANFATPPDGQPGHCNMFLWTQTTPMRDGDLENDIITHELTHGLTNRMTGGGTGACLGSTEAGGMGEGWSDTVAFWSEQNSTDEKPFALGSWVINDPKGIRSVLYSSDMSVDPYTYGTVATKNEVHAIGEVWATILIEAYWALVGARGFTPDITDSTKREGNVVFLQLLVDALALQPCDPTFVSARDAIIKADECRYGGENKCTLWNAFAKRGLGVNAAPKVYKDDKTVPEGC